MKRPVIVLRRIILSIHGVFTRGITFLIYPLVYGTLIVILLPYTFNWGKFPNFFDLSMLSATVGGFLFVGGLLENENASSKQIIRKIGRKFLIAALCFGVVWLIMPILVNVDKQKNIISYYWEYSEIWLFITLGGINFANAIANLLLYLWITRNDST